MKSIVHFEIPFEDQERATKFYKHLGWDIQSVPMGGGMDYVMATTCEGDENGPKQKGKINGGLVKRHEKQETPTLVVGVNNIEESLAAIEREGGEKLMDPITISDMGKYCLFKDTEGNTLGLWEDFKTPME